MSILPDDLRVAGRGLRRSPGFTAVSVASLGLAIGANTAVFSAVDAALFAPLPLSRPERIVRLWEERPARGWSRFGVSAPAFVDWRAQARSLADVAAYTQRSANLAGSERPQRVRLVETTADLFAVLGVSAVRGRLFTTEEETAGRGSVVLLSEAFWRSAFAGDAGIVGRTVSVDGLPHAVVGVLPAAVADAFDDAPLWRPLSLGGDVRRGARWLQVVARLRPDVGLAAAREELAALARRQEREYPDTNTGWTAAILPLQEAQAEPARPLLVAVWAAVGLVLVVACANVAGLMLARAAARQGELAVRTALGATRWRLARLLAAEAFLLATLGGGAAALVALGARRALSYAAGDVLPQVARNTFDVRTLGFTALATLLTALAFGLAPAAGAGRRGLERALRGAGRGGPSSRLRARRGLAAAELAAALALISATGLVVRSVQRLLDVRPGFEPAGAVAFRVAPAQSAPAAGQSEEEFLRVYLAERDRTAAFYDRVLGGIARVPGVAGAGAINRLPLTGSWWSIGFAVPGQPPPPRGETPSASGRVVTAAYFHAMGIPVRAGRPFDARDTAASAPVAIVSESLARRVWRGEDPLGRRIVVDEQQTATVVGVVGDVRLQGLDAGAPDVIYVPFAQATFGLFPDWGMDVVVRSRLAPAATAAAVRRQVALVEPTLPVFAVRTLDELLAASWARRRAAIALLGGFAALAMLLAAVGLYGVVSQSARQRTREIGVRLALGARPADISRLVLGEALALVGAGSLLGLAGAWASGRVLSTLLFEVPPGDPATLAGSAAILTLVAIAASLLPARRASRIQPLAALRDE